MKQIPVLKHNTGFHDPYLKYMREGEVTVVCYKVKDCVRNISGICYARLQSHLASIRQGVAKERICASFFMFCWLAFKFLFFR